MTTELMHDHDVQLASDRLLLRAFQLDDVDAVYEAVRESLPELSRWLPWCHADYSHAETHEFLNQRGPAFRDQGEHAFAILDRKSGRFLGATGVNQIDRHGRRANLGYWLRTDATGNGYATEATLMVARWAFDELQLERIEIVAAIGNVCSQRVATRVGAVREGIARKRLRKGDLQHDAVLFSLIRSDMNGEDSK
jgi:RimJ/RimL family protein N-acetyltransferase